MQRNISIIGMGHLGLTTGACLAYLGHRIICMDKDSAGIRKLREGGLPFFEPGLEEILRTHRKNITFTNDLQEAVSGSEVIFVCLENFPRDNGGIALNRFKATVKEIAKNLNGYKAVVIKSTVPLGTVNWAKKELEDGCDSVVSVVSNPDFSRKGSAIKDFLAPDRIILGIEDEPAKELILDIYCKIKAPKIITKIKAAEMIKHASNAFLATKISFINEIANFCEKAKIDVDEVVSGMGVDKRIGSIFLWPGLGYGGSGLLNDARALHYSAKKMGCNLEVIKSAVEANEAHKDVIVEKIKKIFPLKKIRNKTIAFLGLAFKGNTDDIGGSVAIDVIKKLQKLKTNLKVYDPRAEENAQKALNGKIKFCDSPYDAVDRANLVVIAAEWGEFRELNWERVKNLLKNPVVFDGKNWLDQAEIRKAGLRYIGVGRG